MPGNAINDFINGVVSTGAVTNINNPNSGCNGLPNNYIYYCNIPFQVNAGQTVTCSVQTASIYAGGIAIFIDWNMDNIFQLPSERLAGTAGVPPIGSWSNLVFTVPVAQPNGVYRMRIREVFAYSNAVGSLNPCNLQAYGETEDYNVYVGITPPAGSPITATASPNQTVCIGQNANLGVNFSGTTSTTFSWGGPNSFTSALQNPIVVNTSTASNGYYYVALTSATCPVVVNTHVFIDQGPSVNIFANTSSVCPGKSVTLTASGAMNYTWTPTSSNNTVVVVTPSATSAYTLSGITTGSCAGIKTITITVLPSHTVNIASNPTVLCSGGQATLSASGASSYTWSTGPINPSIVISPLNTTTYSATGSGSLCSSSTIFTIVVSPCTGLNELGSSNPVKINFQNPFHDELRISTDKEFMMTLLDASGRVISKNTIINETVIDTSTLPNGIYFLTIENGLTNKPIKVIKQ